MKNQKWKQSVLFVGIFCMVFFYALYDIHADTYTYGRITVKHERLRVKRNDSYVQFNHPYKMAEDVIANALSSIYYKEKGLFKRKGTFRVFQDDEIRKLTPLIVQAFSVAAPTQIVAVSSYYYRPVLADKHNYCILFVTDHELNIAFSHVHTFQTYNDIMSGKKRYLMTKEDPSQKKRSSFWKLISLSGQRFEHGHENWLVIDLSH